MAAKKRDIFGHTKKCGKSEVRKLFILLYKTKSMAKVRYTVHLLPGETKKNPARVQTHDLLSVRWTHYQPGHDDKNIQIPKWSHKAEIWQNLEQKRYANSDFPPSTQINS